MEIQNSLIILDLETTGIWVEKDKIIEMAFLKCSPDGARQTYHKRINPGMPIPHVVSQLTGIHDEDVKDAPFFKSVAAEVLEFLKDSDFAGFNVERFDLPLLEREMFEAGLRFEWQSRHIYDAQKVYHLNEKRDLTAAYRFYCGKDLDGAHSALADAEATFEILKAQVVKYGNGKKSVEILKEFNYQSLDSFYDQKKQFRWWNGELYPTFGKYRKRLSLQEIARKDPKYLDWILSQEFGDDVKTLVEDALKGQFPTLETTIDRHSEAKGRRISDRDPSLRSG